MTATRRTLPKYVICMQWGGGGGWAWTRFGMSTPRLRQCLRDWWWIGFLDCGLTDRIMLCVRPHLRPRIVAVGAVPYCISSNASKLNQARHSQNLAGNRRRPLRRRHRRRCSIPDRRQFRAVPWSRATRRFPLVSVHSGANGEIP